MTAKKTKTAQEAAQKAAAEQFSKIRDTATESLKQASASLQGSFGDVNGHFSDAQEVTAQAGEVLKQSGETAAQGAWDFDVEVFNFAKDSVASTVENAKTVATVKNLSDLAALQTTFLFNRLEETNKHLKTLADISHKTWVDAATPIADAVAKVADKKAA